MSKFEDYIKNTYKNESFVDLLFKLIDEKGFTEVEIYKKANLDRKYFSKLRCDKTYKPKKTCVAALVLALELDNKTSKTLIKKAGYILSSANKFDVVIRYCIENKVYNLHDANILLDEQGLDTIP